VNELIEGWPAGPGRRRPARHWASSPAQDAEDRPQTPRLAGSPKLCRRSTATRGCSNDAPRHRITAGVPRPAGRARGSPGRSASALFGLLRADDLVPALTGSPQYLETARPTGRWLAAGKVLLETPYWRRLASRELVGRPAVRDPTQRWASYPAPCASEVAQRTPRWQAHRGESFQQGAQGAGWPEALATFANSDPGDAAAVGGPIVPARQGCGSRRQRGTTSRSCRVLAGGPSWLLHRGGRPWNARTKREK